VTRSIGVALAPKTSSASVSKHRSAGESSRRRAILRVAKWTP